MANLDSNNLLETKDYARDRQAEEEQTRRNIERHGIKRDTPEFEKNFERERRALANKYRQETRQQIEKIDSETIEVTGFANDSSEAEPYLDEDEFQRFLVENVPPELHKFLARFCTFEFDKTQENGGIELRAPENGGIELRAPGTYNAGEKFILKLNRGSFYRRFKIVSNAEFDLGIARGVFHGPEDQYRNVPDPIRLRFLIMKAVGSIIIKPPNWEQVEVKIVEQNAAAAKKFKKPPVDRDTWLGFVALYLSNHQAAKELSPETTTYLDQLLEGGTSSTTIPGSFRAQNPGDTTQIKDEGEYMSVAHYEALVEKNKLTEWESPELSNPNIGVLSLFGKARRIWGIGYITWTKTDWDLRAKTEYDNKEVSRILQRDEGIVDRDKRLYGHIMAGERREAFQVLMADSKTSDMQNWRLHAYMAAFDPLYQQTNGDQITEYTYNEVINLRRESNRARRHGTKPFDYTIARDPQTGAIVCERKDYDKYLLDVREEIAQKSSRESLNTQQECFEHMKINGQYSDPLAHIDGSVSTGDLRQFLGSDLAERLKGVPDLNNFDADQICVLARIIAYAESKGGPRELGEHARASQIELIDHYSPIFEHTPELKVHLDYYRALYKSKSLETLTSKTGAPVGDAENSVTGRERSFEYYIHSKNPDEIGKDMDNLDQAIDELEKRAIGEIAKTFLGQAVKSDLENYLQVRWKGDKEGDNQNIENEFGRQIDQVESRLKENPEETEREELIAQRTALIALWAEIDKIEAKIEAYKERLEELEDYTLELKKTETQDEIVEDARNIIKIDSARKEAKISPEERVNALHGQLIQLGFAQKPNPEQSEIEQTVRKLSDIFEKYHDEKGKIKDQTGLRVEIMTLHLEQLEKWISRYPDKLPKLMFDFIHKYLARNPDGSIRHELATPPDGDDYVTPSGDHFETYRLNGSHREDALICLKLFKGEFSHQDTAEKRKKGGNGKKTDEGGSKPKGKGKPEPEEDEEYR